MNKYVAGGLAIGLIVIGMGIKKFVPWIPKNNPIEQALEKVVEKETGLEEVDISGGVEGVEKVVEEVIEKK